METNCSSSGGDEEGDEGKLKESSPNNCSTLTTIASVEIPMSVEQVEEKGVVEEIAETFTREDNLEGISKGKGDFEEATKSGGDLEEATKAVGDLDEATKPGGDLEETPCVCAACCSDLKDIPLTKEDDTVFHWFLRWFRFDPWRRKGRSSYYEAHGGWDGQGGISLRFCKPCKAEVMGLMYFQSKVKNREPFKKLLGKDIYKMRMRMKECEPEFEAKQIYKRDNRYFLLRVKFCKITTCGIMDALMWKKRRAMEASQAEVETEKEEEPPSIRMSRRVKRPVVKYVPPVNRLRKKVKVPHSEGTEEVNEEKNCSVEEAQMANAVEAEPEVQVKLEEFPDGYEEDMEGDNCWFNEDYETEKIVKMENVAQVNLPKSFKENPPSETQKSRKGGKCSKTRGSSKRVSGPKSKVGARTITKVDKVTVVPAPLMKPLKINVKKVGVNSNPKNDHHHHYPDENCLFCYKPISSEDIKLKPALTSDLVEANFNTVFILRKMLQVPKSKLSSFFVNFGDPKNWIQVCRQCLSLVDQAVIVQKKIEELEVKLRELQNEMVNKIKSTFERGQSRGQGQGHQKKGKQIRAGSHGVPSVSRRITEETRQFICTKSTEKTEVPTKPASSSSPLPPPCQLGAVAENDNLENCEEEENYDSNHDTADTNDYDNNMDENVVSSSPPTSPLPLSLSRKRRKVVRAPPPPPPLCQLEDALEEEEDPLGISEDSCDANVDDDTNDQDYEISEDVSPLSPASSLSPPPSPVLVSLSKKRKRRRFQAKVRKEGGDKLEGETNCDDDDPLDQGNYRCPLCPQLKAMSIGNFYVHGIFHYKRQFKCSECDLYWSDPRELEKNPFKTSNKRRTKNNHVCSKETLEKMADFSLGKIWKCAWCPEGFDLDSDRDSHELSECPSRNDTDKVNELTFECLSCPDKKCYRSHEEWLLHRVLEHPKICVTSCLYCNETFGIETVEGIDVLDTFSQRDHILLSHPTKKSTVRECCDFCGVACRKGTVDCSHHLSHSHGLEGRDAWHCPICHYRCGASKALGHHVRLNHALIKCRKEVEIPEILAAAKSSRKASTLPYDQLNAAKMRLRRAKAKLAPYRNPEEYDNDKLLQQGNYFCSLCPSLEKSMSLVDFYGHVIFHYKRPFKCSECNLYWFSTDELDKNPFIGVCVNGEHICSKESLVKMPEFQAGDIWKCAACSETFSKDRDRDRHEEAECPNKLEISVEMKYKCLSCSNGCRNYEEWLLHRVLEHTEIASTSCLFCDESGAVETTEGIDFFDTASVRIHVSSEHPSCTATKIYPVDICDFCGVTFKTNPELQRHVKDVHGLDQSNSVFCRICYYRRDKYNSLKMHVLNKHAVYRETTEFQERIETSLKASQARIRRAKAKLAPTRNPEDYKKDKLLQRGNYFCSLCPSLKKAMSLVEFYAHLIFHYKRPFRCSECNLFWSSPTELEKNPFAEKVKDGEHICSSGTLVNIPEFQPGNIWKCAGCPETFAKDTERDFHEEAECPNKKIKSLEYNCLSCWEDKRKSFRNYKEWLLHRVLEHPEVAITSCLFCDQSGAIKTKEGLDFLDAAVMKLHVATEHPSCTQTKVFPAYICDFCGVTSKTIPDLQRHFKDVHGLDPSNCVSCRICYYRSDRYTSLKKHVGGKHAVHKERMHGEICDVCGMQLYKPGEFHLADHKLLKHGIEPPEDEEFQKRIKTCQEEGCGYRTLDITHFKKHMMKMHGAERKHKCTICGKGFFDSGKLAEHLRIHKNKETKPYQCEICGNSFALRNYLYIHMRLSHLNRPFASTHKKKPPRRRPAVSRGTNEDAAAGNGPAHQSSQNLQGAAPQPHQSSQSAPVPCSSSANIFMEAFSTFPYNNM